MRLPLTAHTHSSVEVEQEQNMETKEHSNHFGGAELIATLVAQLTEYNVKLKYRRK